MRIRIFRPALSLRLGFCLKWFAVFLVGLCLFCITAHKHPDRLGRRLQDGRLVWSSLWQSVLNGGGIFDIQTADLTTPSPNMDAPHMKNFSKRPYFAVDYAGHSFVMNGQRVRIMSGAIHYFRILPDLWEDRLKTMRASGLNTIETYVEWSSHEPEEGQYNFEGQQDLVRFLKIAHGLGFMVILRPGPYICAERDFGGLPYWLLRNGTSIRIRTSDENYLYYVDRYLIKLFDKVRPLLFRHKGPIIMVQVENEYGSYEACDRHYMVHLRDLSVTHLGSDVVLFTTDGTTEERTLECGRVPGTLTTVDFGTDNDLTKAYAMRRRHQASGPFMNSEVYTGWVDNWGLPKSRVETPLLVKSIRQLLAMNASFNLYMFHGGTNFGFKSGANDKSGFQPQITSYDYDAPLTEAGDTTEKFKAIRELIDEFYPGEVNAPVPPPKRKMALQGIVMKRMFGLKTLRQLMKRTVHSEGPLTFENVGHAYGFMLYETVAVTSNMVAASHLKVHGIRDRGYIYVDYVFRAIISRADQLVEAVLEIKSGQTLSILVENQGRINMGDVVDPKGIVGNVILEDRVLTNWTMRPIDLTQGAWLRDYKALEQIAPAEESVTNNGLAVYAANVTLPQGEGVYDTFLLIEMFKKGTAFLNGFNLGRYWTTAGPQKTLYVPSVLFRDGGNLLLLLELEAVQCKSGRPEPCSVNFVPEPRFDGPLHWPV